MDSRGVRVDCHSAAQRIYLSHDMTLGRTPYRRITRHLANRIEILREEKRRRANSRSCQRRFDSGVASPHNYNVVSRGLSVLIQGCNLLKARFKKRK